MTFEDNHEFDDTEATVNPWLLIRTQPSTSTALSTVESRSLVDNIAMFYLNLRENRRISQEALKDIMYSCSMLTGLSNNMLKKLVKEILMEC